MVAAREGNRIRGGGAWVVPQTIRSRNQAACPAGDGPIGFACHSAKAFPRMSVAPVNASASLSPAEMQMLMARAGLALNPGQMADLVLVWRQLAGLIALLPRERPMLDDQAFTFRLPAPVESSGAPKRASSGRAVPPAARPVPARPARAAPPAAKPVPAKVPTAKSIRPKAPSRKPPRGKSAANKPSAPKTALGLAARSRPAASPASGPRSPRKPTRPRR